MLLSHSLTIEFEVRTEAESGLLFYMARINHADFATVQLRNGLPYFSYDLGSGDTNTMIPTKINDGQWHKVIVSRVSAILYEDVTGWQPLASPWHPYCFASANTDSGATGMWPRLEIKQVPCTS